MLRPKARDMMHMISESFGCCKIGLSKFSKNLFALIIAVDISPIERCQYN
jgi:hypothetical protein